MDQGEADMLAVWPTQRTITWCERLCVPLMALTVHPYLPVLGVHHTPFSLLAAANGQCIAIRARANERLGGHSVVRGSVLEDISPARLAKRAGLRLRLTEADGLITCRIYQDWRSVRESYAKNTLAGFGNGAGLIAGTVFHWLVFLSPWVLFGLGLARTGVPGHPWWAFALIAIGVFLRGHTAWRSGQRVGDALLLPVSVLLMTCVAIQAMWWRMRYGGPKWKGGVAIP